MIQRHIIRNLTKGHRYKVTVKGFNEGKEIKIGDASISVGESLFPTTNDRGVTLWTNCDCEIMIEYNAVGEYDEFRFYCEDITGGAI